jgi:hypothetical protein
MSHLNPYERIREDFSVEKDYYTAYNAQDIGKYNHSDVIRFRISDQDAMLFPFESYIRIRGKMHSKNGAINHSYLVNNAFMHLFQEARYLINAGEVSVNRDPAHTSLVRALTTFTPSDEVTHKGIGWNTGEKKVGKIPENFEVSLPLKLFFSYIEDVRKITINERIVLELVRSRTDKNCFAHDATQNEEPQIDIEDVQWDMKQKQLSDIAKEPLLNNININRPILKYFREWESHLYPNLPETKSITWNVRITSEVERPKWIIIFFKTDRNDTYAKDNSLFDTCKVRSVRANINNNFYPHEEMKVNFKNEHTSQSYTKVMQIFRHPITGRNRNPF